MRNSFTLAVIAFAFIMPLALLLASWPACREGSRTDRAISLISLITTSVPEFASGIILILIFAFWLSCCLERPYFTSDICALERSQAADPAGGRP